MIFFASAVGDQTQRSWIGPKPHTGRTTARKATQDGTVSFIDSNWSSFSNLAFPPQFSHYRHVSLYDADTATTDYRSGVAYRALNRNLVFGGYTNGHMLRFFNASLFLDTLHFRSI